MATPKQIEEGLELEAAFQRVRDTLLKTRTEMSEIERLQALFDSSHRSSVQELIKEFNSAFESSRIYYICQFIARKLSRNDLNPAQRLLGFTILHQAYPSQLPCSHPFLSFLENAASDEKALYFERCFLLQLLGFTNSTIKAEVLKLSAEDYIRKFDPSSHQVLLELTNDPNLLSHWELTPNELPELLKNNPLMRLEVLTKLANSTEVKEYVRVFIAKALEDQPAQDQPAQDQPAQDQPAQDQPASGLEELVFYLLENDPKLSSSPEIKECVKGLIENALKKPLPSALAKLVLCLWAIRPELVEGWGLKQLHYKKSKIVSGIVAALVKLARASDINDNFSILAGVDMSFQIKMFDSLIQGKFPRNCMQHLGLELKIFLFKSRPSV
ncbi:hypothetical protein ACH5RR_023698 [Cinchona calisaya]|uniref:CCR4-NOT transcription complex subunit 11 n=1 Tax=Cinchona calisaya TaxID=153742 RepID=A0ABD2ZBE8_9GENT